MYLLRFPQNPPHRISPLPLTLQFRPEDVPPESYIEFDDDMPFLPFMPHPAMFSIEIQNGNPVLSMNLMFNPLLHSFLHPLMSSHMRADDSDDDDEVDSDSYNEVPSFFSFDPLGFNDDFNEDDDDDNEDEGNLNFP